MTRKSPFYREPDPYDMQSWGEVDEEEVAHHRRPPRPQISRSPRRPTPAASRGGARPKEEDGGRRVSPPKPVMVRPRPRRPYIVVRPRQTAAYIGVKPHQTAGADQDAGGHEDSGTDEYTRWVQDALNRILHLRLPVNGIMTARTRSALRRFQERARIPRTGYVGPDTERALISALESQDRETAEIEQEAPSARSDRDYVKWIQTSLNRLIGAGLAVDGIRGPATQAAIRRFQGQHRLTTDGIVGPRTEAAMLAAGAGAPPRQRYAPPAVSAPPGKPDIVNVRGINVARQIAPQLDALLKAAQADGVALSGWGYRSTEKQIELRRKHCGTSDYDIYKKPSSQCTPPTAPPGLSMHEKGLAIDFTYNGGSIKTHDNPGFQWLAANAHRFGLKNFEKEPWHWSVNGR